MSSRPYDEAIEALRQGINELPHYSFLINANGGVSRVTHKSGRWIEWQAVHELLDPVMVDALLAKMQARAAIAKATGTAK